MKTFSVSDLRVYLLRSLRLLRQTGPSALQFWALALVIGVGAGFAALGFRLGISAIQTLVFGANDSHLATAARRLSPWLIVSAPIATGLVVGLILDRWTKDGRCRSVSDVIEGAALNGGRVERKEGLASAVASLLTLGGGGSAGREGPVVHLAAVLSTYVAERIRASPLTGRELLGCAVAGAVAASFNAPIAGALFAHEVILRHFAVHAFAPIAISAVAGAVVTRLKFGDLPEFLMPVGHTLSFYVELPAFALLGLVCGIVAVALMRAVLITDRIAGKAITARKWPRWIRPTIAGALLGLIAIPFPHIIGVGYETTSAALAGKIAGGEAIVLAVVKVAAVAITLGGRMGGGIFSPALVIGSLTGLAFGVIATGIAPDVSGNAALYALAGMGAVGAAVLGAPISTALIVFEMTGNWQTGMAVMTAVATSSAVSSRLVTRSLFLTQLKQRGIHIAEGPQAWLPQKMRVAAVLRARDTVDAPDEDVARMLGGGHANLTPNDTLENALAAFQKYNAAYLPVLRPDPAGGEAEYLGTVHHIDALRALNEALAATSAEEHG